MHYFLAILSASDKFASPEQRGMNAMKDANPYMDPKDLKAVKAQVKRDERVFYAAVARRIRILREAAGLTQRHISDIMGLTRGAVTDWEKGKTRFSVPALIRVAAKLETTVEFLHYGIHQHVQSGDPRQLTANQVAHLLASSPLTSTASAAS